MTIRTTARDDVRARRLRLRPKPGRARRSASAYLVVFLTCSSSNPGAWPDSLELLLGARQRSASPIANRHPIQDVPGQTIPLFQLRVIEVIRWIVGHSKPLHDHPRPQVHGAGKRHDLV